MAENEDRGPGDSPAMRLNQKGRKRREPPIIDASATDISDQTSPETDATEPDRPASESVPAGREDAAEAAMERTAAAAGEVSPNAEPVLFRQAPESVSPAAEGAADPAKAASEGPDIEGTGAAPSESTSQVESEQPSAAEFLAQNIGSPADDPAAAPVPPQSRASLWSPMSAILGIVVLALLGGIAALLYTEPRRSHADAFAASIEALSGRVATLEARPDPAKAASQIGAVDRRAGTLEAQVASLKAVLADLSKKIDDAAGKADANAAKLATLAETPAQPAAAGTSENPAPPAAAPAPTGTPAEAQGPAPASAADLSALSGKVDDLSARIAALPTPPPPAAAPPPVDLGPLDARLADLDHRFDALTMTVAALPRVDLAPLQASVASLASRVAPLEAALSAPKAGDRVTEARAEGDAAQAKAAPLAVVAQTLIEAIHAGRPYTQEIDALRGLGIEDAALPPLTANAAKGSPTNEVLKSGWADLENKVLSASLPQAGTSVLDRLTAGAKSLVQVRRVGAAAGDDATSIVSRIDAALDRGDVPAALAEWSKLPEAGRSASQDWADAARSRLDAEAAAQGLLSRAIATLAKAKG